MLLRRALLVFFLLGEQKLWADVVFFDVHDANAGLYEALQIQLHGKVQIAPGTLSEDRSASLAEVTERLNETPEAVLGVWTEATSPSEEGRLRYRIVAVPRRAPEETYGFIATADLPGDRAAAVKLSEIHALELELLAQAPANVEETREPEAAVAEPAQAAPPITPPPDPSAIPPPPQATWQRQMRLSQLSRYESGGLGFRLGVHVLLGAALRTQRWTFSAGAGGYWLAPDDRRLNVRDLSVREYGPCVAFNVATRRAGLSFGASIEGRLRLINAFAQVDDGRTGELSLRRAAAAMRLTASLPLSSAWSLMVEAGVELLRRPPEFTVLGSSLARMQTLSPETLIGFRALF